MAVERALPRARLAVIDVGRGAKRFEVECPASLTGVTWIPGPLAFTDRQLITITAFQHEDRCGACDLSAVLDRGDQQLRAATEHAWSLAAASERRN